MNRITISICILFVLVLLIYLPDWFREEAPVAPTQGEQALTPNYQATSMRSTFYNEKGELNHRVFAEKMEHYQLLGFTLFEKPQYTIYVDRQSNPWEVEALEGTLDENDLIRLEQDVEIRTMNNRGFVQTIRTNFIEINLRDKTMMSDQPVEIIGQDFIINSNGFSANLVTQQYELQDHVQTVFAP